MLPCRLAQQPRSREGAIDGVLAVRNSKLIIMAFAVSTFRISLQSSNSYFSVPAVPVKWAAVCLMRRRNVHRSTRCCASGRSKIEMAKRSKLLAKFYNSKSKKWLVNTTFQPSSSSVPKSATVADSRRGAVLNALFLENVTDIISTGELGHDLQGLGIEITRVQVSPRFDVTRVFWITSNKVDENVAVARRTLSTCAGKLRHLLCSRNVLGTVPQIMFVEDNVAYLAEEIEMKLATADYGPPDEEQQDLNEDNSTPDLISNKLELDKSEEPLKMAEMKMNVYGLDHPSMMQEVVKKLKKASGEHRNSPKNEALKPVTNEHLTNLNSVDLSVERTSKLANFIQMQKRAKSKKAGSHKFTERELSQLLSLREEINENGDMEKFDQDDYSEESMINSFDSESCKK